MQDTKKDPIYIMEDLLSPGDLVLFNDGSAKIIAKYNFNRDLIVFHDGTERDLRVIYDSIDSVVYAKHDNQDDCSGEDEIEDSDDYDEEEPHSVSISTIKKDVMLAIKQINKSSSYRAYSKVIWSFLTGDEDSWIYDDCCDCDDFGIYNSLSIDSVESALDDLLSQQRILCFSSKKGSIYYEINENYDPAYAMFNNIQFAKKYNEYFFLNNLNNWDVAIPFFIKKPIRIKLKDGYTFTADGSYEEKLVTQLNNKDTYLHLRGNNFAIFKNRSKTLRYFPDIVFYTKDGYIGFIEVKPMFEMADNKVRAKYSVLVNYCLKHGFIYTMCDFQYHTFDFMSKRNINEYLRELVEETLNEKGSFTRSDFDDFALGKNSKARKKYENQLAALVIQEDYSMTVNSKGRRNFVIRRKNKV